jgi:hypothetical protein
MLWKRLFRSQRQQVTFMLSSPKSGVVSIPVAALTSLKLKNLLENHSQALHFKGTEDHLLSLLQELVPEQSMNLENWKIIESDNQEKIVQIKLTGPREIRRVVRIVPS